MKLEESTLKELANLAEQAAKVAGHYIVESSRREFDVMHKAGGDSLASQVVTEVDEQAQSRILEVLRPSFGTYDLALLAEESEDDGSRLEKDYFWCIDPLDGTLPFTQGIAGYSVSIALVGADGIPVIGVVYDPVEQRLYRVVKGMGIQINGEYWTQSSIEVGHPRVLNAFFDCTFPADPEREAVSERMESLGRQLGYTQTNIRVGGGAVLNACQVFENPTAFYFKRPKPQRGGGAFWDFAATVCLFNEAGLHVSDFAGERLDLNRPDGIYMNEKGVCFSTNRQLARDLMQLL